MKLLRATDHRHMPWKNGGGETLEVATSPAGAGIERFDWRVSMAVVAMDGPFSGFPGVDRTLVLLDGDGMTLTIAGRAPVTVSRESAPCAFPADVAVTATLIGRPITDLNVMTARGRYRHVVERFDNRRDVRAGSAETLLLLGDGMTVDSGAERIALGARDAILLDAGETVQVTPPAGMACLMVTIRPVG